MRSFVDISTLFAAGIASLPNTVLAFPNKTPSSSSTSGYSVFSTNSSSTLPSTETFDQSLSELNKQKVHHTGGQKSPIITHNLSPIINSPLYTKASTQKVPEASKENYQHDDADNGYAESLLPTNNLPSTYSTTSITYSSLSTGKSSQTSQVTENGENISVNGPDELKPTATYSSLVIDDSSLLTSSISSTRRSTSTATNSPYTIETWVYTTHTGLKPYEIITTGAPRNQTSTYRPPYIWDNEPLSCYPDYLLNETPPNYWGWAEGYDEGELVHDNRCFTSKANGCKDWSGGGGCFVRPGEVKLLVFATQTREAHATITEPPITTAYDKFYDYTFTYPSAYILYHRIDAWANCNGPGKLGPHITSAFFAYNLEDISTLNVENGQLTGKRQLTLSDILAPECGTIPFDVYSAWANTLPIASEASYRCYPRIAVPNNVLEFAKPWWNGCQIYGESTGLIDPPYVLTAGAGLGPVVAEPVNPNLPDEPSPSGDDGILYEDQTTHIPFVKLTTAPIPIATPNPALPVNTGSPVSPPPTTQPADPGSGNDVMTPDTPTIQEPSSHRPPNDPTQADVLPGKPPSTNGSPAAVNDPVAAVSVSIIATTVITAPPEGSGAVDNDVAVNRPGEPTVITQAEAGSTDENQSIPDVAVPLVPGTDDSAVTISKGGEPLAVDANVNGKASTLQTEQVVYKSHTLQLGGPVATVSSLNAVLSYGANGVIVQYPNGVVSTIPVAATTTPSADPAIQDGTSPQSPVTDEVDNAGDIASFINYVMNGIPGTQPKSTGTPVGPGSSQNADSSLVIDAGNSPKSRPSSISEVTNTNVTGSTLSSSTPGATNDSDSTEDAELFTGYAQKINTIRLLEGSVLGCIFLIVLL